MDPELAKALLDAPPADPQPLSPRGYSHGIFLQMATLEAIRVLDNTLKRVHGNKPPPPTPLPRPVSALVLAERERDRVIVDEVLSRLGLEM